MLVTTLMLLSALPSSSRGVIGDAIRRQSSVKSSARRSSLMTTFVMNPLASWMGL
jgi:hypothetical protein